MSREDFVVNSASGKVLAVRLSVGGSRYLHSPSTRKEALSFNRVPK